MESPPDYFQFTRFQFVLEAVARLSLPEYKGAAFRAGFGYAFKGQCPKGVKILAPKV